MSCLFTSIHFYIQLFIHISIDSYILTYFILRVMIQCYHCLVYCSQCLTFGHCELFLVGSLHILSKSPHPFLSISLLRMIRSCIFPASALESTTSPKKPSGSFHWGMALRSRDLGRRCAPGYRVSVFFLCFLFVTSFISPRNLGPYYVQYIYLFCSTLVKDKMVSELLAYISVRKKLLPEYSICSQFFKIHNLSCAKSSSLSEWS